MGEKTQIFHSYFEKWKIKWKSSFILTKTDGKTLIIDKPLAYLSRKIVNLNDICSRHICNKKKLSLYKKYFHKILELLYLGWTNKNQQENPLALSLCE